jgi:glycosyltransferase involved in cell wall biosynthesis
LKLAPVVSVILPTYNRVELLSNAIRSVLNQTFQDFEIIVVDDFSTQQIDEVVSWFADSRIRLFRRNQNGGEAAARNTGLEQASGELIAFLDDDDEWFPEKLARQINIIQSSDTDVAAVYSAFLWFSWPEREQIGKRVAPKTNGNFYRSLLKRNIIGTPSTVMIRKDCLKTIGVFDSSIRYGVDHDLWIRIASQYKFHYVPEYLVKCHIHDNRITNNLEILIQGQKDMLRKYPPVIPEFRIYHGKRCLSIGEKLCLNQDLKRGRRLLLNSLKFKPGNWRAYYDLFLLLFGYGAFIRGRKLRQRTGRYLREKFMNGEVAAGSDPPIPKPAHNIHLEQKVQV